MAESGARPIEPEAIAAAVLAAGRSKGKISARHGKAGGALTLWRYFHKVPIRAQVQGAGIEADFTVLSVVPREKACYLVELWRAGSVRRSDQMLF